MQTYNEEGKTRQENQNKRKLQTSTYTRIWFSTDSQNRDTIKISGELYRIYYTNTTCKTPNSHIKSTTEYHHIQSNQQQDLHWQSLYQPGH